MTVYYVLNQLGPHQKGDVVSFSPEQIGAGVDIAHLTGIGAIRVASGGEIARAVPAQIQATHAPQGVGVFTNNGAPSSSTYANIAAFGSICFDVSVSPPVQYVNTGTIAAPAWVATLPCVTSGPIPAPLVGVTPDPTYNPTYTFVSGDLATGDSWYRDALVHFITWTPTISGTVVLLPPPDDGASQNVAWELWEGTVIGTDVPSRDGSGASPSPLGSSSWYWSGANRTGTMFVGLGVVAVLAGHTYTLSLEQQPDSDAGLPTGRTQSLLPWIRSTEPLGGQSVIVPWSSASTAYLAYASGESTATGIGSVAEGFAIASGAGASARAAGKAPGNFASAEGTAVASGLLSHAQGEQTLASGEGAHAEGGFNTASGVRSHVEGQLNTASGATSHVEGAGNTASGENAHAEGGNNTASGLDSHAEGQGNIVSGRNAHAEGDGNVASGFNSHVQGQESAAAGQASTAMGDQCYAIIRAELAHASGSHVNQGDSEYRRIIPYHETTDATPTQINPGNGQPMPLGANATWQLLIQITASRHDAPGTTACWSLAAAITTCGTPRIVGTPTVLSHHNDVAAAGWLVALSVDTTTDAAHPALAITVTGQAAQNIYWSGTVHATHVGV